MIEIADILKNIGAEESMPYFEKMKKERPGELSYMPDVGMKAEIPSAAPTPEKPDFVSTYGESLLGEQIPEMRQPVGDLRKIWIGFKQGMSSEFDTMDKIAGVVEKYTGMPKGGFFKSVSEWWRPGEEETEGTDIKSQVLRGIGQAFPIIAEFALGTKGVGMAMKAAKIPQVLKVGGGVGAKLLTTEAAEQAAKAGVKAGVKGIGAAMTPEGYANLARMGKQVITGPGRQFGLAAPIAFGAVEAGHEAVEPSGTPGTTLKAGGKGLAMGAGLEAAGILPRIARPPAVGGLFAGGTAIEGGTPQDIAAAGMVGTVLAGVPAVLQGAGKGVGKYQEWKAGKLEAKEKQKVLDTTPEELTKRLEERKRTAMRSWFEPRGMSNELFDSIGTQQLEEMMRAKVFGPMVNLDPDKGMVGMYYRPEKGAKKGQKQLWIVNKDTYDPEVIKTAGEKFTEDADKITKQQEGDKKLQAQADDSGARGPSMEEGKHVDSNVQANFDLFLEELKSDKNKGKGIVFTGGKKKGLKNIYVTKAGMSTVKEVLDASGIKAIQDMTSLVQWLGSKGYVLNRVTGKGEEVGPEKWHQKGMRSTITTKSITKWLGVTEEAAPTPAIEPELDVTQIREKYKLLNPKTTDAQLDKIDFKIIKKEVLDHEKERIVSTGEPTEPTTDTREIGAGLTSEEARTVVDDLEVMDPKDPGIQGRKEILEGFLEMQGTKETLGDASIKDIRTLVEARAGAMEEIPKKGAKPEMAKELVQKVQEKMISPEAQGIIDAVTDSNGKIDIDKIKTILKEYDPIKGEAILGQFDKALKANEDQPFFKAVAVDLALKIVKGEPVKPKVGKRAKVENLVTGKEEAILSYGFQNRVGGLEQGDISKAKVWGVSQPLARMLLDYVEEKQASKTGIDRVASLKKMEVAEKDIDDLVKALRKNEEAVHSWYKTWHERTLETARANLPAEERGKILEAEVPVTSKGTNILATINKDIQHQLFTPMGELVAGTEGIKGIGWDRKTLLKLGNNPDMDEIWAIISKITGGEKGKIGAGRGKIWIDTSKVKIWPDKWTISEKGKLVPISAKDRLFPEVQRTREREALVAQYGEDVGGKMKLPSEIEPIESVTVQPTISRKGPAFDKNSNWGWVEEFVTEGYMEPPKYDIYQKRGKNWEPIIKKNGEKVKYDTREAANGFIKRAVKAGASESDFFFRPDHFPGDKMIIDKMMNDLTKLGYTEEGLMRIIKENPNDFVYKLHEIAAKGIAKPIKPKKVPSLEKGLDWWREQEAITARPIKGIKAITEEATHLKELAKRMGLDEDTVKESLSVKEMTGEDFAESVASESRGTFVPEKIDADQLVQRAVNKEDLDLQKLSEQRESLAEILHHLEVRQAAMKQPGADTAKLEMEIGKLAQQANDIQELHTFLGGKPRGPLTPGVATLESTYRNDATGDTGAVISLGHDKGGTFYLVKGPEGGLPVGTAVGNRIMGEAYVIDTSQKGRKIAQVRAWTLPESFDPEAQDALLDSIISRYTDPAEGGKSKAVVPKKGVADAVWYRHRDVSYDETTKLRFRRLMAIQARREQFGEPGSHMAEYMEAKKKVATGEAPTELLEEIKHRMALEAEEAKARGTTLSKEKKAEILRLAYALKDNGIDDTLAFMDADPKSLKPGLKDMAGIFTYVSDLSQAGDPRLRRIGQYGVQNEMVTKQVTKEYLDLIERNVLVHLRQDDNLMRAFMKHIHKIAGEEDYQKAADSTGKTLDQIKEEMGLYEGWHRKVMNDIAARFQLEKKGLFVKDYATLAYDMEKIWKNYKEPLEVAPTYDLLPDHLMGRIHPNDFYKLQDLARNGKSWKNLSDVDKAFIQLRFLNWGGGLGEWEYLPESLKASIPKAKWTAWFQERTAGDTLKFALKEDYSEVVQAYIIAATRAGYLNDFFLPKVNRIVRGIPFSGIKGTNRWIADQYIKKMMGDRNSMVDNWIDAGISKIRTIPPFDKLSPTLPKQVAGALVGQLYRGLISFDTALKNLSQTLYDIADKGPGNYAKGALRFFQESWNKTPEYMRFKETRSFLQEFFHEDALRFKKTSPSKWNRFLEYDRKLTDILLSPMEFTEWINRGIAYFGGLEDASSKGLDFSTAHLMGTEYVSRVIPNLTMSEARWHALNKGWETQFGYTPAHQAPLQTGMVAKLSWPFWSFPIKSADLIYRGVKESWMAGDTARLTRFLALTGFMAASPIVLSNLLGIDAYSLYGKGLFPQQIAPWWYSYMKKSWGALGFGDAQDAYSLDASRKDWARNSRAIFMPQGRMIEKAGLFTAAGMSDYDGMIQNVQKGYRTYGKTDNPATETNLFREILNLFGVASDDPREVREFMKDMKQEDKDFAFKRLQYLRKMAELNIAGKPSEALKLRAKAAQEGFKFNYHDIQEYQNKYRRNAYETQYKQMHKEVRAKHEAEFKAMEEKFLKSHGTKSMWKGARLPESPPMQPQGTLTELLQ